MTDLPEAKCSSTALAETEAGHERNLLPPPLSPRKLRAIDLLLSGLNATQTGAALGVGRMAVGTWLRDPQFQAELAGRRDQLLGPVGWALDASQEAATILLGIARDPYAPTSSRVSAAKTLVGEGATLTARLLELSRGKLPTRESAAASPAT